MRTIAVNAAGVYAVDIGAGLTCAVHLIRREWQPLTAPLSGWQPISRDESDTLFPQVQAVLDRGRQVVGLADFDEDQHPRDAQGRFIGGSGGSATREAVRAPFGAGGVTGPTTRYTSLPHLAQGLHEATASSAADQRSGALRKFIEKTLREHPALVGRPEDMTKPKFDQLKRLVESTLREKNTRGEKWWLNLAFDEADHPREADGRFASGSGGRDGPREPYRREWTQLRPSETRATAPTARPDRVHHPDPDLHKYVTRVITDAAYPVSVHDNKNGSVSLGGPRDVLEDARREAEFRKLEFDWVRPTELRVWTKAASAAMAR
jgi:hypothetical protein